MASDRGQAPGGGQGRQQQGGRKILGLQPRTAIIVGLVFLAAGIGFVLYRRRQAAAQQASSGTAGAAGTATAPGPCYDATGNVVDCSDPSAVTGPNASTFQSEIQDLQGELAQAQAAEAQNATGLAAETSATGEQEQDITALEKKPPPVVAKESCPPGMVRDQRTGRCVRLPRVPPRRPPTRTGPGQPPVLFSGGPVHLAHTSRRQV